MQASRPIPTLIRSRSDGGLPRYFGAHAKALNCQRAAWVQPHARTQARVEPGYLGDSVVSELLRLRLPVAVLSC